MPQLEHGTATDLVGLLRGLADTRTDVIVLLTDGVDTVYDLRFAPPNACVSCSFWFRPEWITAERRLLNVQPKAGAEPETAAIRYWSLGWISERTALCKID